MSVTEFHIPHPEAGGAMPWAMQIVVYRDRKLPARQVDVCEAVARAVVGLLDDERATDKKGPWHKAVQRWENGGHIRKLVRRADGKRWTDVQELEGFTVEQDAPDVTGAYLGEFGATGFSTARARAFVPAPEHPQPKAIDKLQVAGTNFPDEGLSSSADARAVVEVSPLIDMTSGKMAAQCGHAAQRLLEQLDENRRQLWRAENYRVQVVLPSVESWHDSPREVSVIDAGYTELDGPTETTRAYWRGF